MQDYSQLWDSVRRLAAKLSIKYAPAIPGVTVDDLLQECFLALIDAAETYRPDKGKNFAGWFYLYVTSRFKTLGQWGKKNPDPSLRAVSLDAPTVEDPDITLGDTLAAPGDPLDDVFSEDDACQIVRGAVSALDRSQRDVVIRRYWDNLTVKDTAAALGVTTADVRREHDHAMRVLRNNHEIRALEDVDLYSGVGLRSFQRRGSQVERMAISHIEGEGVFRQYDGKNDHA